VHATFLSAPCAEYPPLVVTAYLEQLMEVGGDCYFHHPVGETCLLAGVADVSGDGWPAAMDMARVATLTAHLAPECTPENFAHWLVRLNNTLHKAMYAGRNNLALTAMLFDWKLRRVHVTCFGQHAPIYRDAATGEFHSLPFGRQVRIGVGVLKQCKTKTFSMALGSHWFLFSDGFTEAAVGGGRQLGQEGLTSLLGEVDWMQGEGLSKVVAKWKAALPAGPRDDATLLAIEDRSPRPCPRWQGPATPEAIQKARGFLGRWMEFAGLAAEARPQLLIACDEVLTNIVRHAYGGTGGGEIRLGVEVAPECLRFIFEHDGRAISQAEVQSQMERPQRPAGGAGLGVVHRVFTWVHFFVTEPGPGGRIVAEKDFDWTAESDPHVAPAAPRSPAS
jgi:anti-sigma regulatory factor (Ser/Thr protein kinase)